MTASPDRSSPRHWWRDQIARLIITIIGGVTAAIILAYVIPSLSSSGSDTETPDTQTEAPADAGDQAPAEAEEPAPAEGG